MKAMSFIALLVLLVSNQGCADKCKPIVETHYIKQAIPEPQAKPKGSDFQLLQIEFNGKTYYAVEEEQGKLLSLNWLMYKEWAEGNYEVLNKLHLNSK